jgi:hypothetical protein
MDLMKMKKVGAFVGERFEIVFKRRFVQGTFYLHRRVWEALTQAEKEAGKGTLKGDMPWMDYLTDLGFQRDGNNYIRVGVASS